MPRRTERQETTAALLDAFLVHLVAKMEADSYRADTNSDTDHSDEETRTDDDDPITDAFLQSLGELYKERYTAPRRDIPKTQSNLRLLLDSHRKDFPDIFRSYTRVTPGPCMLRRSRSVYQRPSCISQ